jgi:sorbitol-specific phosphotransferase system component IIC
MLQNPDSYAVRRQLVEQLLRSFFGVLWNEFHPQVARFPHAQPPCAIPSRRGPH